MWSAVMWGGISGSAVLLGAIAAIFLPIKQRIIGFIMAFGTGVLIGASTYELLEDSAQSGGIFPTSIGFLIGAIVFTILDMIISKKGAQNRKRSAGSTKGKQSGLAIFIPLLMGSKTPTSGMPRNRGS